MVPYVRKSFNKHYRDGLKYIENQEKQIEVYQKEDYTKISITDAWYKDFPKAYEYAMDMTLKETQQAVEGMFHNLK